MDNEKRIDPQIMAIDDTIVGFWIDNISDDGKIDLTYSILDGPKIEASLLEKRIETAINEAIRIGIEKAEYDRKTNI